MDLQQLKIEFPELYKVCIDIGVEQERDRICGHIQLGRKTGAWATSFTAIDSGAMMTPELFTAYAQAGRAHLEIEARLEDEKLVDEALSDVRLASSKHTDPAAAVFDRLSTLLDTEGDVAIEDLEVDQ